MCDTVLVKYADHPHEAYVQQSHAKYARLEGEPLLEPTTPTGRLLSGAGEMGLLDPGPDGKTELLHPAILNTLEHPNSIFVDASQRRMEAAVGAQVLEPAIDAAVSAGAENSIEKMLWHQMATVHHLGMWLAEQSIDSNPLPGRGLPTVERVRLANAAARMFDAYQNGLLTWKRWKSPASQTVTVQHVHQHVQVGPGGQALVTGSVKAGKRGARATGGRDRNESETR